MRKSGGQSSIEFTDHSEWHRSAATLFDVKRHGPRDSNPIAARLTEQFIRQNRARFDLIGVTASSDFDGSEVRLRLSSSNRVGAVPVISPMSAKNELGIIVQPRFSWKGIGPMLADMGWKVVPQPLKLPLLQRSARNIPAWVMSAMILTRVEALLRTITRRFELVSSYVAAPKGRVDWNLYSIRSSAIGRFDSVPCSYPDLREDAEIKSAIRFTLDRHIRSLQSQTGVGSFVHRLLDLAIHLSRSVSDVKPREPTRTQMERWLRRQLIPESFRDGVQAIEWTAQDRGLAGVADLEGIPFWMSMDLFFEAWVETLLAVIARNTGGVLKTGRQRQTVRPISWNRPFLGSQKALIPDFWLEWSDQTVIVDAKYKRHFIELERTGWHGAEDQLRGEHRDDLFQVLAYAGLAATPKVAACLLYPCSLEFWEDLRDRNQLFHLAEVSSQNKELQLWLSAVPMAATLQDVSLPLLQQVRSFLA